MSLTIDRDACISGDLQRRSAENGAESSAGHSETEPAKSEVGT